ncbi:MAG: bifunctional phosphopantothenoylcysteine decarboxylase/phosphopantothenate--cysteine ligase CoaBC [Candidatus Odinarchaeia archaeon]
MKIHHVSKDIMGTKSDILKGKKIALCITGSVAAIQCPIIARELMRHGAEIYTVMTESASKLITADLMHWATGNEVVTKLDGKTQHILLAGAHPDHVDLVLIAPCTANTISKIAMGIDDTTVTTIASTAFGANIPIAIVPAMHESMYKHPIITQNIEKLKEIGVVFIGPRIEEGKAKMAKVDDVVARTINLLTKRNDLEGLKILVTAGGTREYIDPIRFIGNPSSGRMGIEIALEAEARGADVTLVYGTGTVTPPEHIRTIRVETGEEMLKVITNELQSDLYHIMIHPAAISDYSPTNKEYQKIPSDRKDLEICFKPVPKIVQEIRKFNNKLFLVGFKAETNVTNEELIERAYKRLKETGMNLIVANDISRRGSGFETLTNEVIVVDENKNTYFLPLEHKRTIATKIIDLVLKYLPSHFESLREAEKTVPLKNGLSDDII